MLPTRTDAPFTFEEVRHFQDYDRAVEARGGKSTVLPPARYQRWVDLGSPDLTFPPPR